MDELYIESLEIPLEIVEDLNTRYSSFKIEMYKLLKLLITRLQRDKEAMFYVSQLHESSYREDYEQLPLSNNVFLLIGFVSSIGVIVKIMEIYIQWNKKRK
ncbi:hypothetical protein [uncultured Bacteroides sp.]|jgi:hypothetical protein|uniref:hypothetical protein n=1 Tax=uncultured Bacteroides sp. TaxID=162156 RepID=UPI00033FED7A|nr:hypothetical protein [uncultured Bacteroides sp.]CDA84098.1 unknown [Bacteroides sp. CAG:754]